MADNITREQAQEFATRVYSRIERNRSYALTDQAKTILAGLGKAILAKRIADGGRSGSDKPTAQEEFEAVIEKLAAAGCNILQPKPQEKRALPKPWIDPVTGLPLTPPVGPDEEAVLASRDKALLDHYREMAKHPYKHVAKLLDEESEREMVAAQVFDAEADRGNVFRGTNETEKAEFARRNPILARRYQEEARPVEIPIAGKPGVNKNLSLVGQLSKDPALGAIVKLAEQIVTDWRQADKAAAEEAARAAQAKLEEARKQLATA